MDKSLTPAERVRRTRETERESGAEPIVASHLPASASPDHPRWHDQLLDDDRDALWQPRWQKLARVAIVAGLALFAAVLYMGIRERGEPVAARGIDRADPEALVESTSTELVQSDGGLENFLLEATRQLTYSDGSVRFVDGVQLTVPEQTERDGFVVTGAEATIDDAQRNFEIRGTVEMTSDDGLVAHTGTATYARQRNEVIMRNEEQPTSISQNGMEAAGLLVTYARSDKLIQLEESTVVRLRGDDERRPVEIFSPRATLAQQARYMRFEGGAEVRTGSMILHSDDTTAHFGEEETALERLELRGNTSIRSAEPGDGGLRAMRASETTLAFRSESRVLEQATLAGGSTLELAGVGGAAGSYIESETMDLMVAPNGREVVGLEASGEVRLQLPMTTGEPRQEIRAGSLVATGAPEVPAGPITHIHRLASGLSAIAFNREVVYEEEHAATPTSDGVRRSVSADRMQAGVERGLSGLLQVQFLGHVVFEDESRRAEADEARYDLIAGVVALTTAGEAGRVPRLVEAANTIEAESVTFALDGSSVTATGGVQTVLTPTSATPEVQNDKVPTLLDAEQRINLSAEKLIFDHTARVATYSGEARMWQGATSFQGDEIAIDNQTGDLTISGDAKTTIQLIRLNAETGVDEVSRTNVEADNFVYDDDAKLATYDPKALFTSDFGDLKADKLEVFLQPDGQTLDRLVASGDVKLRMDDRWATGDHLVYFEAEGKYDMKGSPVEIVETVETEDEAAVVTPVTRGITTPPPPSCRSTKGRQLTFYRQADTVTVDGQQQLRTETNNGVCVPLQF